MNVYYKHYAHGEHCADFATNPAADTAAGSCKGHCSGSCRESSRGFCNNSWINS